MSRLKKFITINSNGKKVTTLFVITNLVYLLMIFVTIPMVMTYSNGMKLLDMMPTGYTSGYVVSLLKTLGEDGRNLYLFRQIPVDLIYPGLFAVTYSLLLAYFLKRLSIFKGFYYNLCLLPFIAGVADYGENAGIIALLNSYPELSERMIMITNGFSLIKSSTTSIIFLVLCIIMIIFFIRKFSEKWSN